MQIGTGHLIGSYTQSVKQTIDTAATKNVNNAKSPYSVSSTWRIKDEYVPSTTAGSATVLSSTPKSERNNLLNHVTFVMLESLGIDESDWISCNFNVGVDGKFHTDTLNIQFREGYEGPDKETIVEAFNQHEIDYKPFSQMIADGDRMLTDPW